MKIYFESITKKICCFIFLFFFINTNYLIADIYNEIEIKGNQRISSETIKMFSGLSTGVNIELDELNNSIKNLYKTDYFKKIEINTTDDKISIYVEENPIIQSISIKGIKNKEILKKLSEVTKKSEKYPYLKNRVKEQRDLLINIVRNYGYYFSKLETKLINNKSNSVDIIFNFKLGERAVIKKINFNGNKIFKDTKLRNIIKSEEGKFWKFITSNKYLNEKKISTDEDLLRKFYKNKGYYNVKIESSYAKNIDNKFFELNFNIDSGKKFFFNDFNLSFRENINDQSLDKINKITKKLKGKKYSERILNRIIDDIDEIALKNEFIFINTNYNVKIINENRINVDFIFQELEKFYVERINIFGNFITEEKVIRNSLIIDEGDAYSNILFNKSLDAIKSRRIFKSVNSEVLSSETDKLLKTINIYVEEKPTGEIFAGAGTGTSGASLTAGINENNYLGRGIKLATNLTVAEEEIKGKFSVINPNFNNTDRSLNTTLESSTSDFLSTGGFKTSRTGFSIGTGFEQFQDLYVNFDVSTYYEKLDTSSTASAYKKKQEGDYFENLFNYQLTLNKLDQNFQPTEGHRVSFKQVLPIYSDDLSIENTLNLSQYYSLTDNLILSGKFFFKAVNSIDDDVRVSRRVYIPSNKLRGFESGKIGPKDGDEYVGGNFGSAINLNTTLPNVLSGYENVDLNLFFDAATLREVDYNSSLESTKIRSSTGISVNVFTLIGPLSFSYAIPLSSEPSDKTEKFRFRIGTSF